MNLWHTITTLRPDDLWVMATAAACAVSCAVLGCYLVLRRMSMLGDAISHAILPGLAAAFILTGTRDVGPMLLGALIVGLLTAALSSGLSRFGKVPEDAAMGVVFTSLFALGVLLITISAKHVDLDPGCVLYGLLELVALEKVSVLGLELPRAFTVLTAMLAINVAAVSVFWKELKIVCFDPALATTMGISAGLVHYGLMGLVAGTAVASFEAVGSILVVAMLIAPGATAQMLTDRLSRMVLIAAGVGLISAVGGYILSVHWNTSAAGMVAVVAGCCFVLAMLFGPRHGTVTRAVRRAALSVRIAQEDVLGLLYRLEEGTGAKLPKGWHAKAAAFLLIQRGLLDRRPGGYALSPAGRRLATRLVRGHRLWETYLSTEVGLPTDHLHDPAERVEHYISPTLQDRLAQHLNTEQDPQGKRIPGENGPHRTDREGR